MSTAPRDSRDPQPRRRWWASGPGREHLWLLGIGIALLLLASGAIYLSRGLVPEADGYAMPAAEEGDAGTGPLHRLLRPLLLSPLDRRTEAPDFRLPRVDGETADEVRPVAAELGLAFPLLVDRTRAGQ